MVTKNPQTIPTSEEPHTFIIRQQRMLPFIKGVHPPDIDSHTAHLKSSNQVTRYMGIGQSDSRISNVFWILSVNPHILRIRRSTQPRVIPTIRALTRYQFAGYVYSVHTSLFSSVIRGRYRHVLKMFNRYSTPELVVPISAANALRRTGQNNVIFLI